MNEIPYKEILLLLLGSLSTYLIWRVQYQKDKIKDIESQLSERKYKLYSELVYIIFDVMNSNKLGNPISESDLLKRMLDIKRDLFLYAPDIIFKTFTEWTLALNNPNNSTSHFKIYFKMMKLVRKDMGQSSTQINLKDFMVFLFQNESTYEEFKKINNW
jgi:hypothetical protein